MPATHTAARPTYFLSGDRETQALVQMDDAMHKRIWGRMTYSNQSFDVPMTDLDTEAFIAAQFAYRNRPADAYPWPTTEAA